MYVTLSVSLLIMWKVVRLLNDKSGCCTQVCMHHVHRSKLRPIFLFHLVLILVVKFAFVDKKCLASLLPILLFYQK
jgi:hypothetical protein